MVNRALVVPRVENVVARPQSDLVELLLLLANEHLDLINFHTRLAVLLAETEDLSVVSSDLLLHICLLLFTVCVILTVAMVGSEVLVDKTLNEGVSPKLFLSFWSLNRILLLFFDQLKAIFKLFAQLLIDPSTDVAEHRECDLKNLFDHDHIIENVIDFLQDCLR